MEPFPFWAQVRRALGPGVGLQLIAAQPGQGLGKRLSIASFLPRDLLLCCFGEPEGCGEVKCPSACLEAACSRGGEPSRGRGSALRQPSERKEGARALCSAGVGWCLGVGMFARRLGSDRVGPHIGCSKQGTATRWDLSPETSKARGVGVVFRHSSQGTPLLRRKLAT